jgi:aldehyde:ferredoxin oxidoreductase
LRVDLTREETTEEKLPEEIILKKYIGCFGIALRILYNMSIFSASPLDSENPLIFMTGPLTATIVPAPTNTTIATLNYDTGYTVGRSHSHGFWGPNLKFAGYDGIIIQGAAEKPVYLWIHDGEVEIRDASKIWGKDTHRTEDLVKEDIGQPKASVAAIGPAGENLCNGALIENDKHHSFSHSGVGAVMGSKKLKAIAVYGTRDIPVVNKEKLREVVKKWMKNIFKSDLARAIRDGKKNMFKEEFKTKKEEWSLCATRNLTDVNPPEFGVGMSTHKIIPKPCFRCPIGCSYEVEITSGPYRGYIATLSGGGEGLEGSSSIFGVYESGTVFYLTDLLDRLGLEASTAGCAVALAIECYEKGIITKEDTQGLDLKWGEAKLVEKLFNMLAMQEGWLGSILAKGPKRAAELIGGGASKFAVHIKGGGISLHDWRAAWGILLGQIVGGGAGWPAPGVDVYATEPDVGYNEYQDPFNAKVKPEAIRKTGMKKYWEDCIGTCWFAEWGVPGSLNYTTEALSSVTGWDFSPEEALMVGERLINLERVFNIRRGLKPSDDLDVSPRLLEAPKGGRAKGKSIKPYLKGMILEYYRLMGWDEKTGKPWRSTLERLALDDIIKNIWD